MNFMSVVPSASKNNYAPLPEESVKELQSEKKTSQSGEKTFHSGKKASQSGGKTSLKKKKISLEERRKYITKTLKDTGLIG